MIRDYQAAALDGVRNEFAAGRKRVLIQCPTGGGKTRIALEAARLAVERGRKVVVLTERLSLLSQWRGKAAEFGFSVGHIQGRHDPPADAQVVIAMQQTLASRWRKGKEAGRTRADVFPVLAADDGALVIVDECHVAAKGGTFVTDWLRHDYQGFAVGLTATPLTKGLADTWQAMVSTPPTEELTEAGWLVPCRVFEAHPMDMSGHDVNANTGEWETADIDEELAKVVGDIPNDWLERAFAAADEAGADIRGDGAVWNALPSTVVFAPSVSSGRRLKELFNQAIDEACGGSRQGAVQVSYVDTDSEREEAMGRFMDGTAKVLINVSVVGRGFDAPHASVMVDAYPFAQSVHEFAQRIGRVLRPAQGRAAPGETATLLDHSGNWQRLYGRLHDFWKNGVRVLLPDPEQDAERRIRKAKIREVWRCRDCPGEPLVSLKDTACPQCGCERRPGDRRTQAWDCAACDGRPGSAMNEVGYPCRACGAEMPVDADVGASSEEGGGGPADWECEECGTFNPGIEPYCMLTGCGGVKPERFQQVAGVVREWTAGEPVGVDPAVDLSKPSRYAWAHVCELALRSKLTGAGRVTPKRLEKARKVALARWKEAYGSWPARAWGAPPREPSVDPRVEAWWTRLNEAWKAKCQAEWRARQAG